MKTISYHYIPDQIASAWAREGCNFSVFVQKGGIIEDNRFVFSYADKVVVAPDAVDVEYLRNISGKAGKIIDSSFSLSVFQLRARYVDVEGTMNREYCALMSDYDNRLIRKKAVRPYLMKNTASDIRKP